MIAVLGLLLLAAEPGVIEPLAPPAADVPVEAPDVAPDVRSPDPPKNRLFAALETGLIFGVGALWYWDRTWYSSDWDLRFTWPAWGQKFDLGAVRFDADRFDTNANSHPRAGLYYFQAARGNGLSFAESYLWVFTTSVIWEYVVEFNEFPSINDMILTPQGGAVVGEATYRLGRFFDAGSPTLMNRVGAFLFSPFAVVDDLASGRRPSAEGATDAYGFPRAIHHRFALALDVLASDLDGARGDLQALGVETALVSHRGYRRPGHDAVTVGPGEWTELGAQVLYGRPAGVQGFDFHSSTLLVGRYFRRYDELYPSDSWRPDNVRGWGALLGLSTAFDYNTRDLAYGDDKVAGAGLVGPVVEIGSEHGRESIRFALATYYSFAMVDSLVYAAYGDPFTVAAVEINTPLRQQGYYFGQGLSSASSIVARLGDFELSLTTSIAAYWSINVRDRYQENLHGEIPVSDTRARGTVGASVRPFGGPVRLTALAEHFERTGTLAAKSAVSLETRAGLGAAFVF